MEYKKFNKYNFLTKIQILLILINIFTYSFLQGTEKNQNASKPVTIFVHGTLFVFKHLVHKFDIPLGFNKASNITNKSVFHGKIARSMSKSDSTNFPYENFYYYGWSGDLSFSKRKEAAKSLYKHIKNLSEPITLIGHSHGGNVILELLNIMKKKNSTLIIDRIILLGTPVQYATHDFLSFSNVNKVNVLYSAGDYIQIFDPQGIYKKTNNKSKTNFFSSRTFNHKHENLKQVKVLINNRNPWHIEFICKAFIQHLPETIRFFRKNYWYYKYSSKSKYLLDINSFTS